MLSIIDFFPSDSRVMAVVIEGVGFFFLSFSPSAAGFKREILTHSKPARQYPTSSSPDFLTTPFFLSLAQSLLSLSLLTNGINRP